MTVYKETRTELLETPGGGTLRSAPLFFNKKFCKNVLNTEPGNWGGFVGGINCMTKRQRSLCFSSIYKEKDTSIYKAIDQYKNHQSGTNAKDKIYSPPQQQQYRKKTTENSSDNLSKIEISGIAQLDNH